MEDTKSTQYSMPQAVSSAEETAKKPYIRPELIRYGDIKTLTQSSLSGIQSDLNGWFS